MTPLKPPAAVPLTDLEDLLSRALAKQTPQKPRRRPGDLIDAKELSQAEARVRARFYAPENWELKRTLVLVHEDSNTLLGNFEEHINKLMPTCRRLKRVERPATFATIEYVKGANWLAQPLGLTEREPSAVAEEHREAIIDIHLPELDHVFAPAVLVEVKLIWGGVSRVELMDETRFFSKDKRVQLILPSGMDVLEGMSMESKLKLREWLKGEAR